MDKIIKPLLNEDGTQVIRIVKKGDWYYLPYLKTYKECLVDSIVFTAEPIYYEEKWEPKEGELYWFYNFHYENAIIYKRNSYMDALNLVVGNCFQTKAEAEDINNILTVLDNMKAYYQKKQEAKNG